MFCTYMININFLYSYRASKEEGDDEFVQHWHEKKKGQSHLEFEIYNVYTIYYFVSKS